MSKLVAFFEKKKKKPLKSTLRSALDEKPKEEEELPLEVGASVILPEEQDGGSWSVEPEISPSEGTAKSAEEGEGQPASWMKVSVVSAASVRKKEVLPTWTAGSAAGREEGGEEEGTFRGAGATGDGGEARSTEAETGGAAAGPREEAEGRDAGGGGEEGGRGLRGLDALLNSVSYGGDAGKKYMLPSLRARLSGSSSSYRGNSGKPNFDDDQDLTTVAQLGLYRTPGVSMQDAAAAVKKKKMQQQQGENSPAAGEANATGAEGASTSAEKKKKKKKALATADTPEDSTGPEGRRADEESSTGGGGATPGNTSPEGIFDVWKYVHLGDELLSSCSAAQNNELVKEKYIRRKRWGEQTAHLEQQPVA